MERKKQMLALAICATLLVSMNGVVSATTNTVFALSTEENIAFNPDRTGYPHPTESDRGWGAATDKWEIVDGKRTYIEWQHGLAFTGGAGSYDGEPCGERQATINFGEPKTFSKVIIWHLGAGPDTPMECGLRYWAGSSWIDISFQRDVNLSYQPPEGYCGQVPDTLTFEPVTGSKVRYSFDNCGDSVLGTPIRHGWINEFEVYETVTPTPTAEPTAKPTAKPTAATPAPTPKPTAAPTAAPTAKPTAAPTPVTPIPTSVAVKKLPQIDIAHTTLKEEAKVGEEAIVTVTIANIGEGTAKNIRLTEHIPSSISVSYVSGASSSTGNLVIWSGELKPGEVHSIQHTFRILEEKNRFFPAKVTFEDEYGMKHEISTTIYVTAEIPETTPEEPGFGVIFAITGLLAVAYVVLRKRSH